MASPTCARCGRENPDGAKFCLECGSALSAATAPREERKVVSVLFADLVGFTSQAEQMDPEEVRALLAPYHAVLRTELETYGGTVEKFIGDAVMALFGAPIAHEDDPERAVRAALAIRDALASEGRLHVRIGITTGEALVAVDARLETGEGMAAGDVVNTAARLQSAAPIDGILVDEATYRATSRAIDYADHPPVDAKGKAAPIAVHTAVGARSRFGVDVRQQGLVTLVGRTRELDLLAGAADRSFSERQPQLVTLVGVPGIGKSRLVWELFQRIDRAEALTRWRQGRSLPYAESMSFWALGEIVKAELGILETDDVEAAAVKLTDSVRSLPELGSDEAEWLERNLRPLIGLEAGTEIRGDRRGEAFAAWRRYLETLAEQRQFVLVFEDIHWADDGLLDFVDNVVDWVTDVPLLIVATARPELLNRRPGWGGGKPNALTVSLAPLSEAETSTLVGALIEEAIIPVGMRDAVLSRAQGNPLYAEEFARLLAAGGTVDDLPESVQGIVAARLDGVSRAEKDLLQNAAVLGKIFWNGAVAVMADRARDDIDDDLHALERREFVRRERRSSVATETEYAFRHILMRDVAYAQIPRAQRAQRHVRAAGWIESLGRSTDHAELLAHHYLEALELDTAAGKDTDAYAARAAAALAEAADHTMALNAFPQAVRYLHAALDLTGPDDPARPLLLFTYGKALRVAEDRGGDEMAQAEELLRRSGDLSRAAEAAVLQAELSWFDGEGEQVLAHLQRAEALVDDLPESESKAYVLGDMGRYRFLRGDLEPAIAFAQQSLEMAERLGSDDITVHALINLGSALGVAGHAEASVARFEQAIALARRINSPELPRALNNLAVQHDSQGEWKRAVTLFREAMAAAQKVGNRSYERFLQAALAELDYADGAWEDALRAADKLISEAETKRASVNDSSLLALRLRIRLARGDVAGALDDAERAVAAGHRTGDPQMLLGPLAHRAWLLVELGRHEEAAQVIDEMGALGGSNDLLPVEGALAMRALGRNAEIAVHASRMTGPRYRQLFDAIAQGRLEEAARLVAETEARPQAALLSLAAAQDSVARGDATAARELLAPAIELWQSVGAKHWLERAEGVLAAAGSARAAGGVPSKSAK